MVGGFKIGFIPGGSYRKMACGEICADLRSIGYDAVEWFLDFVHPDTMSVSEIKNVFDESKAAGLEVSEIIVQQDLVVLDSDERKRNAELVLRCIELYASLGVNTINLFTGPQPWLAKPVRVGFEIKAGDAWAMVFDAFDRFVPAAEKNGMALAVENVFGMLCHDFFTNQHLNRRYNSPCLGVNFDPSHDVLSGNLDSGWLAEQWGKDKIKHVHLKDAAGVPRMGEFVFPLLGEGRVNWPAFAAAMKKINYEDVMSVEFESFDYLKNILGGDMSKAARISMDAVRILIGGEIIN